VGAVQRHAGHEARKSEEGREQEEEEKRKEFDEEKQTWKKIKRNGIRRKEI
jgi:ribosomal protein L12E/L44/L45/RPP1/RPP2